MHTDKFQLIVQSNLSVRTPLYYCTSSERKKKLCKLKIPHLPPLHHFSNNSFIIIIIIIVVLLLLLLLFIIIIITSIIIWSFSLLVHFIHFCSVWLNVKRIKENCTLISFNQLYSRTSRYGHFSITSITDSFQCPDKIFLYFLKKTPL